LQGKLRDIQGLRDQLCSFMPLNRFIEAVDKSAMIRVSDELYKKRCNMDIHPTGDDGEKDTTPSFTVQPQKGFYYCFGCGASGDHIQYVEEVKKVSHIEAMFIAADIMGFDLQPYMAELTEEEKYENELYANNGMAREFAHQKLFSNPQAMDYMLGRGFTIDTLMEYKIGYADRMNMGRVTTWDGCIAQFKNELHLVETRSTAKKQFDNAILFPVTTPWGAMRYFQSRPFEAATKGQRYIGADDDHPLYSKEDRFFGFDIMRRKLHNYNNQAVVVEGAPDTMKVSQAGFPTFGALGTTINKRTYDMCDKYRIHTLILLFDGDSAGRIRTKKIARDYLKFETDVRLKIALLPMGYDPDDYIGQHGFDAIKEVLDSSVYVTQYLIDILYEEMSDRYTELNKQTMNIDFMWDAQELINAVNDPFMKKIMIQHVASKIGISTDEVEDYYLAVACTNDISLASPEGEEIVLGEMLRDEDFCLDMSQQFDPQDWYLSRHRNLFDILQKYGHKDVLELRTIIKNLSMDQILTDEWIKELLDKHGDVEFFVDDIEDKLIRRAAKQQINMMEMSLNDLTKDPRMTLDQGITDIYSTVYKNNIDRESDDGLKLAQDWMEKFYDKVQNPVEFVGVHLGPKFYGMSKALLGLDDATLTVVAGNQTVGKTVTCQNWAEYISITAPETELEDSLWLSLEMTKEQCTTRFMSMLSGVESEKLRTGHVDQEELRSVEGAAALLAQSKLHIADQGHDLSKALSIARRHIMKYKAKVIFIDYVQLQMISGTKKQRYQELGLISKAWKQLANEFKVAVVLVSQLSKQALIEDDARAEHGAGSYEIAQDADNYITLKRRTEDEINEGTLPVVGNIKGLIDKNRHGERDIPFSLYLDGPTQRIGETKFMFNEQ